MIEDITISQLTRKALPSKHKEGETYNLVNIVDAQNRQLSTFGAWADGWNVGDIIKGIIEPKEWTNNQGFKQTSFNIKNPNAKTFTKGGFTPAPSTRQFQAYQLAIAAIPLLSGDKKITMALIDKLAVSMKKRIDAAKPAPTPVTPSATPEVPTIGVDTPTPPTAPVAQTGLAEGKDETFDFDETDPFGENDTGF